MPAMLIALVAAVLVTWHSAYEVPRQGELLRTIRGDTAAVNYWTYRKAVSRYVYANPSASGTIPDSSLTFETGYNRSPNWTNTVSGGTLYVYSTTAMPVEAVHAIAKRGGYTAVIGVAQSDGTMTSYNGQFTNITLPSGIPPGAIVTIGL